MTTKSAIPVIEFIREHGYVSRDPDWPHTFILPKPLFIEAMTIIRKAENIKILDGGFKYGYLFLNLDGEYKLRSDTPDDPYRNLWEEMNEKDSTKSTDL